VEALNEWTPLGNPNDASEGESYIWIGKTVHTIKKIRINQVKTVELKCAISSPGVYNMNRFKVVVESLEGSSHDHMFVNEIVIKDAILVHVVDKSLQEKATGGFEINQNNLLEDFALE